jgi:hypothetical protein
MSSSNDNTMTCALNQVQWTNNLLLNI